MKIIITMAGLGSRFQKIGIKEPKHEIIVKGKSLFEWSLSSLKDFFDEDFIFIVRKGAYTAEFLEKELSSLGIKKYNFVEVNEITEGQAMTALHADKYILSEDSIVIYNIDTYVEEYSIVKSQIQDSGFIPVFRTDGDKWSFIKINEKNEVIEVTEKVRVSDLATIGFYYFNNWDWYKQTLLQNKEEIIKNYKEAYVAPLYNYMIKGNKKINYKIIPKEKIHVLGTPEDVNLFNQEYKV